MAIIQFSNKEKLSCSGNDDRQTVLKLPVAPRPFYRVRFDPLESKARAVPPVGALNWLAENLQQGAPIRGVDIDGPGDPLCDIDTTLETLLLIHRQYPEIALGITTLGLHAGEYAASLAEVGLQHVTLLVDAVDQKVAEKLYAWIRPGNKTIPLPQATKILIGEQRHAVKIFKRKNCKVTVRATIYPGVNDEHIEEIAERMAELGADTMELAPYRNTTGQEKQLLTPPTFETMQHLQNTAAKYLETSIRTKKENRMGIDCPSLLGACAPITPLYPKPTKKRPNVAVVSSNGMEVDLHLGQAYQVLIYGPREDGLPCLLGTRQLPQPGSGSSRWEKLAKSLHDCFAILVSSAGDNPRRILAEHGITVIISENEIEGTVDVLYGGGKKKRCT